MQLAVNSLIDKAVEISVDKTPDELTVLELRQLVARRTTNGNVGSVTLSFHGRILDEDCMSVAHYGIEDGTVLDDFNAARLRKILIDYINDTTNLEPLQFPPTTTKYERFFIHIICMELQLFHHSLNIGKDRVIMVGKTEFDDIHVKKSKVPKRHQTPAMTEVLPEFLFLGSAYNSANIELLKKHDISFILDVTREWNFYGHQLNSVENGNNGDKNARQYITTISHKKIQLKDVEDETIHTCFEDAFAFIDSAREKSSRILIHCYVGRSRSATIVLAYLMRAKGMSLQQAFAYLKERREFVCPNKGFMSQLIDYEAKIFGHNTMVLEEYIKEHIREKPCDNNVDANSDDNNNNNNVVEHERKSSNNKKSSSEKKLDQLVEKCDKILHANDDEILQRGVKEACNSQYSKDLVGRFAAFVCAELKKNEEFQAELAEAKLAWKIANKTLNQLLYAWYSAQVNNQ